MMDALEARAVLADLMRLRRGLEHPITAVSPDPKYPTFLRWADVFLARLQRHLESGMVGPDPMCYFIKWDARGRWAVFHSENQSLLVAGCAEVGHGAPVLTRDYVALDLTGASRYAQARARQFQGDSTAFRLPGSSSPVDDGLLDSERIAARFWEHQEALSSDDGAR